MSFQEFLVPSEAEWLDALGLESDAVDGEITVRRVRWSTGTEDVVTLTFDVPGQSVRFRWLRGAAVLVDIFREGARRLSVSSGRGEARVVVAFETAGLVGELTIQLLPEVRVNDRSLFV